MAELTQAEVGGQQWWTVGLEAAGPAGLLFASPLPAGTGFSLDNSRSYIQWLYDQTREVPGDAGKPRLQ